MIQQGTIVWEVCSSVLLTKMIFKNSTKVIMTHFRPKKSSFVSGNRSGEKFLSPPARIVECVSEYVFLISKKQTSKKNNNNKNAKK